MAPSAASVWKMRHLGSSGWRGNSTPRSKPECGWLPVMQKKCASMSSLTAIASLIRPRELGSLSTHSTNHQTGCVLLVARPVSSQQPTSSSEPDDKQVGPNPGRRSLIGLVPWLLIAPPALLWPQGSGAASGPGWTVLVAGADGRTGTEVVQMLRQRGVNVSAGVRDIKKASKQPQLVGAVKLVQLDVTRPLDEVAKALEGVDAVICCLGFRPTYIPSEDQRLADAVDNRGVCKLVDASVSVGLKRFVLVSSLLVNAPRDNPSFRALNLLGGVLDAKRSSERHLRASSVPFTIIRPGVFAKSRQGEVRLMAEDHLMAEQTPDNAEGSPGRSCLSPYAAGGSAGGAICAITRAQVALVCVESLYSAAAENSVYEMYAEGSLVPGGDESSNSDGLDFRIHSG